MASGTQNEDIQLKYIHFLVSQKQVKQAADIRRQNVGDIDSMTNAGFENEITGGPNNDGDAVINVVVPVEPGAPLNYEFTIS